MKSLLLLSFLLIFASKENFCGETSKIYKNQDGKWVKVIRYDSKSFARYHINCNTGKAHGKYEKFDSNNSLVESGYFYNGKSVSHSDFKKYSNADQIKQSELRSSFDAKEPNLNKLCDSLAIAWKSQNLDKYAKIVQERFKAKPNSEISFLLMYADSFYRLHNYKSAEKYFENYETKSAVEKIKNAHFAKLLKMMIQREKFRLKESKNKRINNLKFKHSHYPMIFPGANLVSLYIKSQGSRVNLRKHLKK